MRKPFETVVVRPNPPLREGLARALVATNFSIVASAAHIGDLAQILVSRDQPVLLIIDASNEPDDAVSQIKLFKKQYPQGRVAVLAYRFRRSDLVSAYRAGANAYFIKTMSCGSFIKMLELVMLGETILPPELLPFIRDREDRHEHARTAPCATDALPREIDDEDVPALGIGADTSRSPGTDAIPRLSIREKCILRCIVEGGSNKSIARKIDIAEATVKVHVKGILRKLRASNRTQAAIWAVNNGSLVWSTGADVPPTGDDRHGANGARRSISVDIVAGADVTLGYETVSNRKMNGGGVEVQPGRRRT